MNFFKLKKIPLVIFLIISLVPIISLAILESHYSDISLGTPSSIEGYTIERQGGEIMVFTAIPFIITSAVTSKVIADLTDYNFGNALFGHLTTGGWIAGSIVYVLATFIIAKVVNIFFRKKEI